MVNSVIVQGISLELCKLYLEMENIHIMLEDSVFLKEALNMIYNSNKYIFMNMAALQQYMLMHDLEPK